MVTVSSYVAIGGGSPRVKKGAPPEPNNCPNFRLYATVFSYLLLPQPRVEFSVHSQYATRTIRRNSSKRKKVDITASNLVRTSFGPDHLICSGFEVYVFEVTLYFELYE